MLNNVSPNGPEERRDVPISTPPPIKPQGQPRDDSFRKKFKDHPTPTKEESELSGVEEQQEDTQPLSPFDLPKKGPVKNKSSLSKTTPYKDLSPEEKAKFPPSKQEMPKENQFEGEEMLERIIIPEVLPEETPLPQAETPSFQPKETLTKTPLFQNEEMPISQEDQFFAMPEDTAAPVKGFPQEILPGQTKGVKSTPDQAQFTETTSRQVAAGQTPQQPAKGIKKSDQSSTDTRETEAVPRKEKSKVEDRSTSTGQEKVSVTAIPSALDSSTFQTEKAQESQETTRPLNIKDLAAQIIERIQIMTRNNETSTMITLRHPPVLTGATITLTTLTTGDKPAFNIAFANLSPDAKVMLDRKLNEESLSEALNSKGITVNMITTTTQPETLMTIETGQAPKDQQQREQQQPRQQRPQPQEEEENP